MHEEKVVGEIDILASQNLKLINFEMLKLRPLKLCKLSSGLYVAALFRE